jgi:hypothetical protein
MHTSLISERVLTYSSFCCYDYLFTTGMLSEIERHTLWIMGYSDVRWRLSLNTNVILTIFVGGFDLAYIAPFFFLLCIVLRLSRNCGPRGFLATTGSLSSSCYTVQISNYVYYMYYDHSCVHLLLWWRLTKLYQMCMAAPQVHKLHNVVYFRA